MKEAERDDQQKLEKDEDAEDASACAQ